MPLVNAKEMIEKAREGHYAVGAFNINNLEWTKAILQTAEELKAPGHNSFFCPRFHAETSWFS